MTPLLSEALDLARDVEERGIGSLWSFGETQLLAKALLALAAESKPEVLREEIGTEDFMPRINGVTFRCSCGCNVFRKLVKRPEVYVCNSCGDRYVGES